MNSNVPLVHLGKNLYNRARALVHYGYYLYALNSRYSGVNGSDSGNERKGTISICREWTRGEDAMLCDGNNTSLLLKSPAFFPQIHTSLVLPFPRERERRSVG